MKHPIFNIVKDYKGFMKKQIDIKSGKINFSDIAESNFMSIEVFKTIGIIFGSISILKNTHIISSLNEDFKSTTSDDTIKSIGYNNIKLPFKSGTIMTEKDIFFFVDGRGSDRFEYIYLIRKSRNGVLGDDDNDVVAFIGDDKDFNGFIDDYGSDFFSICLYYSTFKSDIKRISKPISIKTKRNKEYPPQKIIKITLKDTITINDNKGVKSEGSNKSSKLWIVRGHWRQQHYKDGNKPKWIDSYWKGNGSEAIQKIYKI